MKSAWRLCVILLLTTGLVAQTAAPSKPAKKKAAAITAADIQALRDAIAGQQAAIAAQQQQIQELRDQLSKRDQAVQQAQTAATDAAGKADAAQAATAQQQQTVTAMSNDVTDLKANMVSTVSTIQDTQKNVTAAMESPLALHFKGVTLTPGGFLAAEFIRRSRALGSDVNTPFNSVGVPGASTSTLSEFYGSGRQSRIALLAEGRLKDVKLSGYYESDFLSAGVTSNNNQSNSYTLRQRQVWGQAAFDNGWSFTGGQMWSLVTETKHGVDNRTEALPMTIDANYSVGFSWARQYGLRVAKNFNNKLWLAASVENPQATLTAFVPKGLLNNFVLGSSGVTGGLYNNQSNYAFNPSPDIVAKVVFEPGFGHYEVFGVYSRFRERVYPCGDYSSTATCTGAAAPGPSALGATNVSRDGGGVGANVRFTIAKHLDLGAHGFAGNGIERYGSGGLPDSTVWSDGSLHLLRGYQALGTLEWHGPKLDVYLNGGGEYVGRSWNVDQNPNNTTFGLPVGYGSQNFDNSGCYTELAPTTGGGFAPQSPAHCRADSRFLVEGTVGFWYRFYKGPRGTFQWGPQFSYVNRSTWVNVNPVAGVGYEPHGLDGMVFTSFRYYLP